MKELLMVIFGTSFGMLAAAGVFTVLVAVGIIPRFAGFTHTAGRVVLYEEMVIFGTITGCIVSLFPEFFEARLGQQTGTGQMHGIVLQLLPWMLQGVIGLFSGLFVGCLALAIAEMLDSIPIFTRRISFRHGLGIAVIGMAAGKVAGSLFYFINEMHRTVQ